MIRVRQLKVHITRHKHGRVPLSHGRAPGQVILAMQYRAVNNCKIYVTINYGLILTLVSIKTPHNAL